MAVHFHQTAPFEEVRAKIEDHLYKSVLELHGDVDMAIQSVDRFSKAIDRCLDVLEQMYQSPRPGDDLAEKSFPIDNGRYRVFFKVVVKANNDFDIFMLDIDDNKQSNLDRFPSHRLITFDADEE